MTDQSVDRADSFSLGMTNIIGWVDVSTALADSKLAMAFVLNVNGTIDSAIHSFDVRC